MTLKDPTKWESLEGLPEGAHEWSRPDREALEGEWHEVRRSLSVRGKAARYFEGFLCERHREFAIENGQIEDIYRLLCGVTEELVAEGLHCAMGPIPARGCRTMRSGTC